jgi:hypothetical protein
MADFFGGMVADLGVVDVLKENQWESIKVHDCKL